MNLLRFQPSPGEKTVRELLSHNDSDPMQGEGTF